VWSKERVKELKKLWAAGLTGTQIAKELGEGLTRGAIMGKVHRLKLPPRHPRKNGEASFWTKKRVELLKQLWVTSLSATKIAKVIGKGDEVTRNGVIGKAHRLGLPRRRKASLRRNATQRSRKKSH